MRVWVVAALLALTGLPGLPRGASAQESCPASANSLAEGGWTAYRSGDMERARSGFEGALARCPDHLSALTGLGYVALREDSREEARRLFTVVVGRNPDSVDALTGLGLVAWREGDLREAALRFGQLQRVDPASETAAEYLAQIPEGYGPPPERPPLVLPDTLEYPSRANGDRLEVRTDGGWEPIFVKGVNLGAALPGRNPSEFPDSATYAGWLDGMAEMNANVVRTYTIHPPDFYEAFLDHNLRNPDRPLWLVHGVWTELPEDHDFLGEEFEGGFFQEMHDVVDLLHGRADIEPKPGKSSGHYTVDVSDYVLGFIIGREWEPYSVIAFDSLHPDFRSWDGRYVQAGGGNAMDAWLAKAVEEIVAYETETYGKQRPVAYTNWPTLDPLDHPSETTVDQEVAIRESLGETVERAPLEYDNDGIGLDPSLAEATEAFPAGLFASYHAYPYYPDFMILSDRYEDAASSMGPSRYFGYLTELKAHHDDMPLVISEYGVPGSLGIAHLQPQGWHHGGHSEDAMARIDNRLTLELAEANTAGGVLFAWMDEWFKKNWIVIEFEIPLERNRLWYNRLDAEQHYGLLAMEAEPPVAGESLTERGPGWSDVDPVVSTDGATLRAAADAAYLWLRIDAPEAVDGWRVGFDLVDPEAGDFRWPGDPEGDLGELPVGVEFVLEGGLSSVRLMVDPPQNPFTLAEIGASDTARLAGRRLAVDDAPPGYFLARGEQRFNRPHVTRANADGRYDSLRVLTNRRRFTRDTVEWLAVGYDRGVLPQGAAPDGLWEIDEQEGVWEVRIPWMLLNFTDPSQRRLLQGRPQDSDVPDGSFGTQKLDAIRMVLVTRSRGGWSPPPTAGRAPVGSFTWSTWEEPEWRSRRRPVFDVLSETFRRLDPYDADGMAEIRDLWNPGPAPTPDSERPAHRDPDPDPVVDPGAVGLGDPARPPTAEEANEAWMSGDVDMALEGYRARLEVDPEEGVALHRVALILAWREQWNESLDHFARLLTVQPGNLEAQVDRARVYAWQGEHEQAVASLDAVLEDDPSYRPALEARAQFQAWAGRYDDSLDSYDRLLSLSPADAEVRRSQARVLTWASRFEASEALYDSILAADPDDLEARLGRARLHTYSDRTEEALAEYAEVIRRDGGNLEAKQGTARALSWGGRLIDGEQAWRDALSSAPADVATMVGLAQNLRWQGRNAAALEVLDQAAAIAPSDPDAREQRRWIDAALSPQVAPSVVFESDSDDNRMLTTSLSASWHPAPRLGLRVDSYDRELEQGSLFRRAFGATVTGSWQFEPGWRVSGGVGASQANSDAPGQGREVAYFRASASSPSRYSVVGTLGLERSALDATALLAQRGVVVERTDLSGRWAPARGWEVSGSVGRASYQGSEANRRDNGGLGLSRRFGRRWNVGVQGRAFRFEKDLGDGYFDPDFYGITEAVGRWLWEPRSWSVSVESAAGVQQVRSDGDPGGTVRVSARVTYRIRPGRELSLGAGYSSTGLQSFSTGASDYRYTAIIASGAWAF